MAVTISADGDIDIDFCCRMFFDVWKVGTSVFVGDANDYQRRFVSLLSSVFGRSFLMVTLFLLRFANHLHADCSERRFSVQNAKKAFVNTNPRGS